MTSLTQWERLHDATLLHIEAHWESGIATLHLQTGVPEMAQAQLRAHDFRRIECPRQQEWGPSCSINQIREPPPGPSPEYQHLEIEMQSGDVIRVEAVHFDLVVT